MTRPDWKDAPEWAQFLAMDADGEWYWYESMPRISEISQLWCVTGKMEHAGSVTGWRDTLSERP